MSFLERVDGFGHSPLATICNSQLLDEVEHNIMNYQCRGLIYLPKPKAEIDNTITRFDNS